MTGGKIPHNVKSIGADIVRNATGAALHRVKTITGMSSQTMAERLGKEDRKTALDYLSGERTMDMVAFFKALADPDFGPAFGNAVLGPIVGMNLCGAGEAGDGDMSALPLGLSELLTAFLRAYSDMSLNHQETLTLANMIRPLMPHFQSIIADADRIAG